MGAIVLYTHTKNWEDPLSRFGEKAKNTTCTDRRNDKSKGGMKEGRRAKLAGGQTDRQESILYVVGKNY